MSESPFFTLAELEEVAANARAKREALENENARLRGFAQWVSNAYERADISHPSFRVRAKQRADAILFGEPALVQSGNKEPTP